MATIGEMKKRLIDLDLSDVRVDALKDSSEVYLDEQRNQMFDSKNMDQSPIRNRKGSIRYSDEYASWKARHYPNLPRHITLHLTGYFYSKFEFNITPNGIEVTSDDKEKLGWLEGLYGSGIWGIGGPYLKRYVPVLQKEAVYYVKKALKL